MEGDYVDASGAALFDCGAKQEPGVALAAGFGSCVEVEEIGAGRFQVHPVWGEVLEEDAGAGEDLAVLFKKETYVGPVGEVGSEPEFEGGVHLGEAIFGCELVVGEHEVAMLSDPSGVFEGGAAYGRHGPS